MKIDIRKGLLSSAVVALGYLSGCTTDQLTLDVQESIGTLKISHDYHDWNDSPDNIKSIVLKASAEGKTSDEICQAIRELPDEDLALVQQQIQSKDVADVIAECKSELVERINAHWSKFEGIYKNGRFDLSGIQPVEMKQREFVTREHYIDTEKGESYYSGKGDLKKGEFVLTFDDGPHSEYTDVILDILAAYKARSIFFITGCAIERTKEATRILKRTRDEGHAIGNHSYSHRGFIGMEKRGMEKDIQEELYRPHQQVFDRVGEMYPFFRFPGGTATKTLKNRIKNLGVNRWHWNIDSKDFSTSDPREIVKKTVNLMDQKGQGIILFHDIQMQTVLALPEILRIFHERGYSPAILLPKDKSVLKHQELLSDKYRGLPLVRSCN
jgi:peptidoglycan/xylan/chitin deacetylase (PgdA/CDA1 family)